MTELIEPEQTICGVPFCGDLGAPQGHTLIHGVAAEARIAGAAFVEYVPEKDPTGTVTKAIARPVGNVIAAVGGQAGG